MSLAATPQARAELYLTLARAFLPPQPAAVAAAFRGQLADDLQELATGEDLAAFRCSLEDVADELALLQLYSRLFLVPPRLAHLNAGMYLDGALMGASAIAMQRLLDADAVACRPDFHELPDHLSVQLEFLALLHVRGRQEEADDYARRFVRPWLPALAQRLEAACTEHGLPRPYAHLAAFAAAALWEGRVPSPLAAKPARKRKARPLDAVLCGECRQSFVPAAETRAMKHILRKRGKPSSYLDVCPQCRQL